MELAIKQLESYALLNYEAGGHWVYETHGAEDYARYLQRCNGDLEQAKKLVREQWEFMVERERECAFGGEY